MEILLLGVVTVYNPELKLLEENIDSYINCVEKLIVWDNTNGGTNGLIDFLKTKSYFDKLQFCGDGKNYLIAYPLNQALKIAQDNGYSHLLTMDQDSVFEPDSIMQLSKYVHQLEQSDSSIAIIGTNPNEMINHKSVPCKTSTVITSGTVYNVGKIIKIGAFREDYGIDAVDLEVCYRAKKKGYSTYIIPQIVFKQQYGDTKKTRMKFYTSNYSAFRRYHITRNYLIMRHEYPDLYDQDDFLLKNFLLKGIIKIILAEDDKLNKLRATALGLYDGLRRKTHIRKL